MADTKNTVAETTPKKRTTTKRKATTAKKPVAPANANPVENTAKMDTFEKKSAAVEAAEKQIDALKAQNEQMAEMMKMMQEQMAQMQQRSSAPQFIQVAPNAERVVMAWMAPVSDDNTVTFGRDGLFGMVTGKTGTISVPKSEWSRFYNDEVRTYIKRRWLIYVSGMDDAERATYGMDYKEGELLEADVFRAPEKMGDKIKEIYPKLCANHKRMVASRWLDAFNEGREGADDYELVLWLNNASGDDSFATIVSAIQERDRNKGKNK